VTFASPKARRVALQAWLRAVDVAVRVDVGEIRRALALDAGKRGLHDPVVERDAHRVASLTHREKYGSRRKTGGDPGGLLGGETVVDVEVAPAAVEVHVAVGEVGLLLGEALPFLLRGIIFRGLIEPGQGPHAVGVAPGVVGGGGVGAAEFG
jgi:hypothetical protein